VIIVEGDVNFLCLLGDIVNARRYASYLICGIVIVEALRYGSACDIAAFISAMQAQVGKLRTGNVVLHLHHSEVFALRCIDKNQREISTPKESQSFLSIRVRKPMPIPQLDRKAIITKQCGELVEFIELVLARWKRRTELEQKSTQLACLAQWFNFVEDSLADKALQLSRTFADFGGLKVFWERLTEIQRIDSPPEPHAFDAFQKREPLSFAHGSLTQLLTPQSLRPAARSWSIFLELPELS